MSGSRPVYTIQAVAFLLLAVAWWQVSGTGRLESQVNWLVLGIVALCVSLAACLGRLYAGRRRIALRRARLARAVEAKFGAGTVELAARAELVATADMTRFHRADCQLVRGKDARIASRTAHESAGRTPCGVCGP